MVKRLTSLSGDTYLVHLGGMSSTIYIYRCLPAGPLQERSLTLLRAVITGKDSKYNSISDLKGSTFGISRLGSGSQVMASVLGMNEAWSGDEAPKFKGAYSFCAWAIRPQDIGPVAIQAVNGQFKPLRDSVNSGESE
jgi:hypothetical protein